MVAVLISCKARPVRAVVGMSLMKVARITACGLASWPALSPAKTQAKPARLWPHDLVDLVAEPATWRAFFICCTQWIF
jgi:hypothetical protein